MLFDDFGKPVGDDFVAFSSPLGEYSLVHASIGHENLKVLDPIQKMGIWNQISVSYRYVV